MLTSQPQTTARTAAPFSPVAVATATAVSSQSDVPNTEGQILAYTPRYIVGGASHPGVIVEPPGLANVEPPPIHYRPSLPRDLSEIGKLSAIQIERVIYAGQAHGQKLADGSRAGISIGDGTGTGKTATLAGIFLDNWFRGRRRAVWFSVKSDLIEAVLEEFNRLGLVPTIKLINDYPTDGEIDGEALRDCRESLWLFAFPGRDFGFPGSDFRVPGWVFALPGKHFEFPGSRFEISGRHIQSQRLNNTKLTCDL